MHDSKTQQVQQIFSDVAEQYDLMNQLLSFGQHHQWKQIAIDQTPLRHNDIVLDLATGSGDLLPMIKARIGQHGCCIASDYNLAMLKQAQIAMAERGISDICYTQINAERIAIADDQIDVVTMAFGIRNVSHIDQALAEVCRVLKPGGAVTILEFTPIQYDGLFPMLYQWYAQSTIPLIGQLVTGRTEAYQDLVDSIEQQANADEFSTMMQQAGLEKVRYHQLLHGLVSIHQACAPL